MSDSGRTSTHPVKGLMVMVESDTDHVWIRPRATENRRAVGQEVAILIEEGLAEHASDCEPELLDAEKMWSLIHGYTAPDLSVKFILGDEYVDCQFA